MEASFSFPLENNKLNLELEDGETYTPSQQKKSTLRSEDYLCRVLFGKLSRTKRKKIEAIILSQEKEEGEDEYEPLPTDVEYYENFIVDRTGERGITTEQIEKRPNDIREMLEVPR